MHKSGYQLPKGIVCLLSALRFNNFTTQSPHEIWKAIGQKPRAPKISSPPIRLIRMSGAALRFGVKQHKVSGEGRNYHWMEHLEAVNALNRIGQNPDGR